MARPKTDTSLANLWILFNQAGWVTAHILTRYQRGSPEAFVAVPMYAGKRRLNPAQTVLVRPFGGTGKIRVQPLETSIQVNEVMRVHGPVKDALSYPNVTYWGMPFNRKGGKLRGEKTARPWTHFITNDEWTRITAEVGPLDPPPV